MGSKGSKEASKKSEERQNRNSRNGSDDSKNSNTTEKGKNPESHDLPVDSNGPRVSSFSIFDDAD